jgi:hypothetical protein
MANRSRLQIAKADIREHFDRLGIAVFRFRELAAVLRRERAGWRLAQNTTFEDFVRFLQQQGLLRVLRLEFPHRPETVYLWGDAPELAGILRLKDRCYFSHYTAMRWLELTEQVPSTLYLSYERVGGVTTRSELTQQLIDDAFRQPPRTSQNVAQLGEWRIALINSANTSEEGVVEDIQSGYGAPARVRFTNIERTLIDAVVRPAYCGGASEVAKAFELGRDRFSVSFLSFMLKRLNYNYPYHQAVGFYMDRAGYRPRQLRRFRENIRFDFYLTHGMEEARYVPDWRLFVPAGL